MDAPGKITCKDILDAINIHPGLSTAELSEVSGYCISTVRYTAQHLAELGKIRRWKYAKDRAWSYKYYPKDHPMPDCTASKSVLARVLMEHTECSRALAFKIVNMAINEE